LPSPSLALDAEADAFDRQIADRVAHGHIPDLRRVEPCDWFYNNPWRRPAYVQLEFGEQAELIRQAIRTHAAAKRPHVLEVGCGAGFLSLELARSGIGTLGLDLSQESIDVARRFAGEDPWAGVRAPLEYRAGDLLDPERVPESGFDAVVFLNALHHFPDQAGVMARVTDLLRPGGLVVAHDMARDRVSQGNAAFAELLEGVLVAGGSFFRHSELPDTDDAIDAAIQRRYAAMKYEDADGGKVQSANDNSAGYGEMSEALRSSFVELEFQWRYAFFNDFIGGLRFDEQTNERLARFLREMDRRLVSLGVLDATQFFFVGRRS
jgi:SAM-dependent methyltransferase